MRPPCSFTRARMRALNPSDPDPHPEKHTMDFSRSYLVPVLVLSLGLLGACGDESGGGPTVDSDLLGVYSINRYQGGQLSCDQREDLEPQPPFLVLYSFVPNDDMETALLGGLFCGTIEACRQAASEQLEPQVGYSFVQGNDEQGWFGWAIAGAGAANDQCRADVQAHVLTDELGDDILIETQTFEVVFPPALVEGNTLECRNRDALASLNDDLECQEIIIVDATFEASL